MDLIQLMYWIVAGMMGLVAIAIMAVVAGKDIIRAFKRRFNPRGCEVFVANTTRNISQYYLTPKDNVFKVDGVSYVTNPRKTMNLSIDLRMDVAQSMIDKDKRISEKIKVIELQKIELIKTLSESKDEKQQFFLKSRITQLEEAILKTREQLDNKNQNYFMSKRPAFFYIEGDPIPKDFYEWYSLLDSKMVDNLVSRAISQPMLDKEKKSIEQIRLLIIIATIAAGIAAFLAIRNNAMLIEICRDAGLNCQLI